MKNKLAIVVMRQRNQRNSQLFFIPVWVPPDEGGYHGHSSAIDMAKKNNPELIASYEDVEFAIGDPE